MNSLLSFTRFIHLFKAQWVKSWKSMAILSVITAGLMAIGLLSLELQYQYRPLKYQEVQQTVFALGFILISIIFCLNFYFQNWYGSKKIAVLSLPVSVLERTLLSFVWMTLIFCVWYLSLFYLINVPLLRWANSFEFQAYQLSNYNLAKYSASEMIRFSDPALMNILAHFILLQTLLLASLLWFNRYSLIKSITAVFLIALSYVWFQDYTLTNWLTPPEWIYDDYTIRNMKNPVFTEFNEIRASSFWSDQQHNQLYYVWMILWGIIYYRMKEQEV